MRAFVAVCLIFGSALLVAQSPEPTAGAPGGSQATPAAQATTELPVRRVILYKTGIGYFEHLGRVRGSQPVTLRFTSAQLDDVLKSLTALDLSQGRVTGIAYNSIAPIEQRLGALRLPLGGDTTSRELLHALRGARLEVSSGGAAVQGRLLSVEQRTRVRASGAEPVDVITLITDAGALHSVDLTPAARVRLVERDLRRDINTYLDVIGSAREQDVRSMVIATAGTGERDLFVSYISEVPIWKSTYRLVIPEKGRPLLQGWAIVDNTVGEDWRNVELSLVAGAPQSFIQQISQPYYGRRAVVPLPTAALLTPQAHGATLAEGTATLAGTVRDSSGGVIPGVRVRALSGGVEAASAITDRNGAYELSLRGGQYEVLFELPGFRTQTVQSSRLAGGTRSRQDAVLEVGAASESVTVQGFTAPARRGVVGGVVGGLPDAPPPPPPPAAAREAYNQAAQALDAMASTSDLGDLFEYRIKEPISISRNQSALVPIINAEVDAERVSLWDRGAGSGRPLRAVWITNASGLTLDGGSMTVIDGNTFAGEGLIEPLKPGERRLLSYAADLGTLVEAKMDSAQGASGISRIRAQNGVIIQESEERAAWVYRVRSEDSRPTTLIVEHRFRPGWDLAATEEPAERASGAARYRLTVAPRAEATLTVREVRRQQAGISIDSLDDRFMLRVSQSGIRASELERQLAPVIERRGQLAAVDGRIARLEQERKTINEEQARLRENMKALRGSAEERQLLQRYTRQLDTQENRLEAIGEELAQARGERERVAAQLSELMRTLSFDISSETGR